MSFFICRLWNWCKRFRYRCGYGVHSPSDFFFITSVVYERLPYYAYGELEKTSNAESLSFYRRKVNRLLFRLINFFQPAFLIHAGREEDIAYRYMKMARSSMKAVCVDGRSCEEVQKALDKVLKGEGCVDFLHVGDTPYYAEVVERMLPRMEATSCLIVGGIYTSKAKEEWWKALIKDERVRVTFDLFDVGIVWFDSKRYKQDYIVNFF